MRNTVFWELMNDEFGPGRAQSIFHDLALSPLGSRTPRQALDEGEDPRIVWLSVCEMTQVPPERHLGRPDPKKAAPGIRPA